MEVNPIGTPQSRIVHPQFNPNNNLNNIAVLRLPIQVPGNVQGIAPIRLPNNNQANAPFTGQIGMFAGHGRVANVSPESRQLRFTRVRVIPLQQCAQVYGTAVANANVLCTVGEEFDVQSPCDLDFGGPLVVQENTGATLIGVHSFVSNAGCVAGQPAGFVRLGGYLAWIRQTAGIRMMV